MGIAGLLRAKEKKEYVLHTHSSSSSALDAGAEAVADVKDDATGSDTASSNAALRLCVVLSFSVTLMSFTLGRALFNGLPMSASAGMSLSPCTAPGG